MQRHLWWVELEEQLKFTYPWWDGWLKEYGVSLRKQIEDALFSNEVEFRDHWNVWQIKFFFNKNFNEEPQI